GACSTISARPHFLARMKCTTGHVAKFLFEADPGSDDQFAPRGPPASGICRCMLLRETIPHGGSVRRILSVLSSSFLMFVAVGCARLKDVDVDVATGVLGYEFSLIGRGPTATGMPFIEVKRTDGEPSAAFLCEVSPVSTKQTMNVPFRFVYEQ